MRRHGMTFDQVADAVRRSSWTCRRCGQSGGNPAADDRAGLPQGGVRGRPGPLDATRREPPPPRRRGDARRRLRGGRPAAPLRRRDGDDGLRLPHRGNPRAIDFAGPQRSTSRDARTRPPAGMSLRVCQDAAEIPSSQRSHMLRNELRRVRARVPGADAVLCRAAAGVLGSLGVPDLVPRRDHADAGPRRPRFVVTNRTRPPRSLYERVSCTRGDIENRIKELLDELQMDRTRLTPVRGEPVAGSAHGRRLRPPAGASPGQESAPQETLRRELGRRSTT